VLDADRVSSVNFTLKPGSESVKIDVQANATAVDTTTGSVGQTIDEKTITELPLNGRNPAALVALSPGAIDANQVTNFNTPGPGSGFPSETAASVNGSRMGGVYYQLDGLVAMNNYFQTADPFPNADATEEFHVLTNNFDAQYGYTAGALSASSPRAGRTSGMAMPSSFCAITISMPPTTSRTRPTAEAESVWRIHWRSDYEEQTLHLRQSPAYEATAVLVRR